MASQAKISFLKRMFSGSASGESLNEVTIGDRFQHHGGPAAIWVVERISRVGGSSFPLVSLVREGHPDLTKVVSIAVLEEGEDFTPAA